MYNIKSRGLTLENKIIKFILKDIKSKHFISNFTALNAFKRLPDILRIDRPFTPN